MMRSLYAGVSGLQNHQTRMDTIGNNISNVNTHGFKRARVNFHDIISQTTSGAARPNEQRGGVNPKQVGLGMSVATIDTIHTQGALQTTNKISDMAITGDGFFIVRDGGQQFYTRAGAFDIDAEGVFENPANGMRVQGWMADAEGNINTADDVGDLSIPVGAKDPAKATTEVEWKCNLDKNTTLEDPAWEPNKIVYDSFGRAHNLQVSFERDPETVNVWLATVNVDPANEGDLQVTVQETETNQFRLTFNNEGTLVSFVDTEGNEVAEGALNVNVGFNVADTTPGAEGAITRQNMALNLGEIGSTKESITQFSSQNSTKAFRQDGFQMGYMKSYAIDQSGIITAVYTNGNSRSIGQVALATFTNPGGLEKNGQSTYSVSNNSGDAEFGVANVAGKGGINAGMLEMSNVDLAEQFTDMIVTQRGFQANSRTITTSDQMLQELLSLKR